MRGMKKAANNPNPNGKAGGPISLAPLTLDDALRKMLAAPPEPKPTKKAPQRKNSQLLRSNCGSVI